MRVHHLSCGTMCPRLPASLLGRTPEGGRARLVCHVLLIEAPSGLVLVDTGYGLEDLRAPAARIGPFRYAGRPLLDPEETALGRLAALGYAPGDVRDVVLTHLDLDHAGGLADFPDARVHVMGAEHRAATAPPTAAERLRYRPIQWRHGPRWRLHAPGRGERWRGFEAVRALEGLPPEILMIPLGGHSRGHAGVAVDTGRGWLLHAGDAYFFRGEIDPRRPRCPPGLALFQRAAEIDRAARLATQARLRALAAAHAADVRIFCAHDEHELRACARAGAT